ncbi:MAG: FG-GAP repeat protein [Planctomycetes bacterium]|nr:FG-GAP repeat protein [Planctomycetota bacterium]
MRITFTLAASFALALPMLEAGDFNGDGFEDLAVGAPTETIGGLEDAGAVHVIPGSASGPNPAAALRIDATTVGAVAADSDRFANSLAWGDFNGDGFDDLAIGCRRAKVGALTFAGRVYIVPGGVAGFDFSQVRAFDQNTKGIKDKVESDGFPGQSGEGFGARLASGDFDGNGFDDLAIQVDSERIGKVKGAGAVHVLYGSGVGLRAKRNQFWHQNSKGIQEKCEEYEWFGTGLATGDLNGDGRDELVVSCPGEQTSHLGRGRVAVLFGSKKGLRAKGNRLLMPDSEAIPLTENSGWNTPKLACGDFDGDGFIDIAIGMTNVSATVGGLAHGAVFIARGSATGPTSGLMDSFAQGVGGVPGLGSDFDAFGATLAVGDFDGDARHDLAIAATGEAIPDDACGRVTVLYGSIAGLGVTGVDVFDQGTAGIDGVPEQFDQFGITLAGADTDGDGAAELVVGVPFENLGGAIDAGAFHVMFGSAIAGLTTAGTLLVEQDTPGIIGAPGDDHMFAGSIAQ